MLHWSLPHLPSDGRRWWIGGVLAVVLVLIGGSAVWSVKEWPFTRDALTRTLEERLRGRVVFGQFRETWFPPGCVADDVRLLSPKGAENPPLITARNLIIRTSWLGLVNHHIGKIKVVGLHLTIPPAKASGQSSFMLDTGGKTDVSSIAEIEFNDAVLELLPPAEGWRKTTMEIHQLVLDHLADGKTAYFHLSLKTGRPTGEVKAQGSAGPWNTNNAGTTPISGIYQFADANLAAFKGLRGTLSSAGKFSGNLSKIDTAGSVDVPRFQVDGSAESVHLMARFRATVDTQTADTVLEEVEAHVGRTIVVATGNVSGGGDAAGKTARLDMTVDTGRLEDLLNYFSRERHPSMTGDVRFRAHVELPPGPGFLRKVRLTGDFGVSGGEFTSPGRQTPVNHLSDSAQGEKKPQEDPRTVLSNIKGHVAVRDGTASLTNVSFEFPGALAEMNGTYNLIPQTVDIRGTLRTDGTLSDATSGIKALMVKVATPFLKKKRTTIVPFAISGSSSNPTIGLDLRNKVKL